MPQEITEELEAELEELEAMQNWQAEYDDNSIQFVDS